MTDPQFQERYHRQLILNGFGLEAQQKLTNANILVIGAGGLGCPILQYLAAAGIGHLGIADADIVSLSNLPRQILFTTADVGIRKAESAKNKLLQLNPYIKITVYVEYFEQKQCLEHFKNYDIIVDATDNFASRYLINDACVLMQKPLVMGAVSQFEGQVAVLNHQSSNNLRPINYRDLFPVPPQVNEVQNCSEAGILGVLPGIIGTMQATEVIKLITGIGQPLIDQLLIYNALNHQVLTINLQPNLQIKTPETTEDFIQTNYEWLCSYNDSSSFEIVPNELSELLLSKDIILIDVREKDEIPKIHQWQHLSIPLSTLETSINELKYSKIVFICQSGTRSLQAALTMSNKYPNKTFLSIKGGINAIV